MYSLKNPSYPEYQFWTNSPVMSIDIHPQHSHMLVLGLNNGNVCVYNLQKDCNKPSHCSVADKGKHSDIVWQVQAGKLFILGYLLLCLGEMGSR